MKPILSIITINLNNIRGLQKTVQSVRGQKFQNFEFIIIDGDSSDNSKAFIGSIERHLTYWVSESDRGIYHAMNKGIRKATGTYCLFLNSGDWLTDEYVLTSVFTHPHTADLLVGNCNISENGTVIHVAKPSASLTLRSFIRNTLPHQATFIKRELFDRFGLYDERYKLHADYDFWLRSIIIGQCSVQKLDRIVADYNTEGLSSDVANNPDIHREATNILTGYFPKTVLDDYYVWIQEQTNSRVVLDWLRSNRVLYAIVEFLYKIAKNIRRIRGRT